MKRQTFVFEIIGNENENWQGRLQWVQGGEQQCFRSIIELLALIESALQREKERQEEACGTTEKREALWTE